MRLRDVLNKFTNNAFLITIHGMCTEWDMGIDKLKEEEYYSHYADKKVASMAIISTNMQPELCIELED